MTVTYTHCVSNAKYFGLVRLLALWKGSIYKLLYKEVIIFCLFYCVLFGTYSYLLNPFQQRVFENVSLYCAFHLDSISPCFLSGLYISLIVYRWWKLLDAIPSSGTLSDLISAFVRGSDERSRIIRRTLARWATLMIVLTFQCISVAVKKRFPTTGHLVEAGLMTEEKDAYEKISIDVDKWWVPGEWFAETVYSLSSEGRITHCEVHCMVKEMELLRDKCEELFAYDHVSVPLAFTQLVTISAYVYFVCLAMGRQCLNLENNSLGFKCGWYILGFLILEFFFYMGLLKVAEQLINPFGEDDDDFDVNSNIDSGFQESLLNVDGMHDMLVDLEDHVIGDDPLPLLPYTKATANLLSKPHLGSARNLDIDSKNSEFLLMHDAHHIDCEEYTNELSESTTVLNKRLSSLNLSTIPESNLEDASFESSIGSEIGLDFACFDQNTGNMLNESNISNLSNLIEDDFNYSFSSLEFSRQSSPINVSKIMKNVELTKTRY